MAGHSSYLVRAGDAAEAADLNIHAYLAGRLMIPDDQEAVQSGRVEFLGVVEDGGERGVMTYHQPRMPWIDPDTVPSWNTAIEAGYEPGTDPQEWLAR